MINFVDDYYNYTITISITENELFSKYEWIEKKYKWLFGDKKNCQIETYIKEIKQEMLNDFIYNQNLIKSQLLNDLGNYESDSLEVIVIRDFYNKWKHLFKFKIDELEVIKIDETDLKNVVMTISDMLYNNVNDLGNGEHFKDWCENGNCWENRKEQKIILMNRLKGKVDDLSNEILKVYEEVKENE